MVATVVTKASNTISKLERSATKRSASNNNSRPTTTADVVGAYNNDTLFGRKIEIASEGLSSCYTKCFYKIPLKENALTLANYIIALKSEINLSNSYRLEIIEKISRLSIYHGKILFKEMTREQILDFLDNLRKPEASDPLHKWIGTYNIFLQYFMRFFKWLYYPDIEPQKRQKTPKPSVIENIPRLKRKEISIYNPSDLWTNEDDVY